jgi:hypothetical protein
VAHARVSVSIGHRDDPTPMTAYFYGVLRKGHELSPELIDYLDPQLGDTDLIAFLIGGEDEHERHGYFFLARGKFERASYSGPVLVIEVGGLKIAVTPDKGGL